MSKRSDFMIYCVEDDASVRGLIIYTLISSGFDARGFENSDELFEALREEKPELILLDVMLPGEDGISILKSLRSNRGFSDIPVIMETAKTTEYDKVTGLDCGADDYLAKPFGMMEMVSHIKAVLRRAGRAENTETVKIGGLELNKSKHTVTANGKRLSLTLKEYELLRLLMDNIGRVFTRDQLLDLIWGTEHIGETRTVDVHIGTLRSKLGELSEYIETVRGVGYRMEEK